MLGSRSGDARDYGAPAISFRWCAPGTFRMGSPDSDEDAHFFEQPQIDVTLTQGFWLGQTEVTQKQWMAVMATEPWKEHDRSERPSLGDDFPATYVSWLDAVAFCKKLTTAEHEAGRLPSGWTYALPTEAQWEYACRAGTTTRYHFDEDPEQIDKFVWHVKNAEGVYPGSDGERRPHAHLVGTKQPNSWGLHDMSGNVTEWCRDAWSEEAPGGKDPFVSVGAEGRLLRGGDFYDGPIDCRCAGRGRIETTFKFASFGFRIAIVPTD